MIVVAVVYKTFLLIIIVSRTEYSVLAYDRDNTGKCLVVDCVTMAPKRAKTKFQDFFGMKSYPYHMLKRVLFFLMRLSVSQEIFHMKSYSYRISFSTV